MAKFNFKRAVVAVGGNAVERDGDIFSSAAIEDAASFIRPLSEGRKLAIVHGNGPQFGFLSERYERMELYDKTAADVIKDSQDAIGSLLQWKLLEVDSSSIRPIAVDNTYVVIDPTDPSFENPVKGVGAWRYGSDFFEANNMSYTSHPIEDDCFREVVSSPKPLEVVDIDRIQQAVDSGLIIICGGGGGIPVFKLVGNETNNKQYKMNGPMSQKISSRAVSLVKPPSDTSSSVGAAPWPPLRRDMPESLYCGRSLFRDWLDEELLERGLLGRQVY